MTANLAAIQALPTAPYMRLARAEDTGSYYVIPKDADGTAATEIATAIGFSLANGASIFALDGTPVLTPSTRTLKSPTGATMLNFASGSDGRGINPNTQGADLEEFDGSVTLNRTTNGPYQYGAMVGNVNLQPPTGGAEGLRLDVSITYTTGAHDLTFTDIKMSALALAALPITLEALKSYLIRLTYRGGGWCLDAIEGPNDQTVSPP